MSSESMSDIGMEDVVGVSRVDSDVAEGTESP